MDQQQSTSVVREKQVHAQALKSFSADFREFRSFVNTIEGNKNTVTPRMTPRKFAPIVVFQTFDLDPEQNSAVIAMIEEDKKIIQECAFSEFVMPYLSKITPA